MRNIEVSVIIPVYNLSNYIERTINSIINQSIKNFEVIIVDDGSKDDSLNKIKKLTSQLDYVKVISQKNRGVNYARTTGLKESKGKYVVFIDGDDYVHYKYIEKLYYKITERDYDICMCGFSLVDNKKIYKEISLKKFDFELSRSNIGFLFDGVISPSLCGKIIKKDFMIKNKIILFTDLRYGEDLAVIATMLLKNPSLSVVEESLYYYYQREDSAMHLNDERTLDIIKVMNLIEKNLKTQNIYIENCEKFDFYRYIQLIYMNVISANKLNWWNKEIYYKWKKCNIKISNNKLYKQFFKNENIIVKIKIILFNYNYILGKMFVIIRGLVRN